MIRAARYGYHKREEIRRVSIETFKSNSQKIKHILQYGILAPSTHNTQPWKFKIKKTHVLLMADLERKIPEADPTGRDMYISIGALLKNIVLAAGEFGVKTEIIFNKSLKNRRQVAVISFENLKAAKQPRNSKILDAIINRQNYRGYFQSSLNTQKVRKVLESINNSKKTSIDLYEDLETRTLLATLTSEGLKLAYANPRFRKEISSLINHNLSKKQRGLHGFSLRMSLPASIVIPKVMKRKDIGAKLAINNYQSFISAPCVLVLKSKDDEESWIQAGMLLEHVIVLLTALGIQSSIYAAAIEMGDIRSELTEYLHIKGPVKPQLLVCIGHATEPLPFSLRKDLSEVLIK